MIDDIFLKPPICGRIPMWLGSQMVQRLLDFAHRQRDNFRNSRVWNDAEKKGEVDLTARRSWKLKPLGDLENELQARAQAAVPEMSRQLGSGRCEPSKFEMEMVAHGDGAFFAQHCDRFLNPELERRLISAVYYFHQLPKSFSGGALRVYPIAGRDKSKSFVEIEPENDTLVFFPSWYPHEVLPVNCPSGRFEDSRFAINCWIHC